MIENYARWVVRWRWLVIPLCIALIVAVASGAQRIRFQSDYRMFFGDDNPQLAAFESLQSTFQDLPCRSHSFTWEEPIRPRVLG